jgi:hypothetical protein
VLKGSLKATWKLRVAESGNPSNLIWLEPAQGKQEEVKRTSAGKTGRSEERARK